ncbi:uncharacterized protein METZ01_LOCUS128530, partial [marine metagenome]
MKKIAYIIALIGIMSLFLAGCAKKDSDSTSTSTSTSTSSDGDGGTGGGTVAATGAPVLSGAISSSSSSSSRTLSEARNFRHLLGRSSERSRYNLRVSDCTAKAYDPTDDSLKATTTAADNGTYTFTESQLTKGVMYRVSVECTYGGETV